MYADLRRRGQSPNDASDLTPGFLTEAVLKRDLISQRIPIEADDPTRAFDRQWATTVLGTVLERLREACDREGLGPHWVVFEGRVLGPIRHGCGPVPVEDLVRSLGVRDRDEIYSMQNSVKRKFRSTLREVVAETVDDPAELDAELAELRGLLSV